MPPLAWGRAHIVSHTLQAAQLNLNLEFFFEKWREIKLFFTILILLLFLKRHTRCSRRGASEALKQTLTHRHGAALKARRDSAPARKKARRGRWDAAHSTLGAEFPQRSAATDASRSIICTAASKTVDSDALFLTRQLRTREWSIQYTLYSRYEKYNT